MVRTGLQHGFAAIAAVLSLATGALADPQGLGTMQTGEFTLAPFGYVKFCRLNPADCAGSLPATLSADPATLAMLRTVNATTNRAIAPRREAGDRWQADVAAGDCEDFALTKRRELVRRGVPAGALRIAFGMTPEGEGHAVLIVRTAAGDLALDNRFDAIRHYRDTDIAWVKIASEANPRFWQTIEAPVDPSIVSAEAETNGSYGRPGPV